MTPIDRTATSIPQREPVERTGPALTDEDGVESGAGRACSGRDQPEMGWTQLLLFVTLTFVISWSFWIPMAFITGQNMLLLILGTFGPTVAAVLATIYFGGIPAFRSLLGMLLIWRVDVRWYLFSFLSPIVIILAAIGIHLLLGGEDLAFNDPRQIYLVVPVFLYVLLFSVAGEELGWRGFALPRLLEAHSALVASLAVGLVWAAWHLPLFWTHGDFHRDLPLTLFAVQILGFSILYTWLWVNTRGSLLIAHIFHAASNTAIGLFPVLPMDTGGSLRPLWLAVGLLWVTVVAVILISNFSWTSRDSSYTRDGFRMRSPD